MVDAQEPRTTKSASSILDMTPMASDPKHILRISTNLLFCFAYASPGLTKHNVQNNAKSPAYGLESEDKGPPSVPIQRLDPTPTQPKSISKLLDNAELRTTTRQMAQEEAKCSHSSRVKRAICKSQTQHKLDYDRRGCRTLRFTPNAYLITDKQLLRTF